jgi:hypothetical protein
MARHLDWERANKSELKPYDPRPGEEISEHSAREDQEFLAKRATLRKKRTKYVRSSPKERATKRLIEMPETVQERRLKTVLAAVSGGKALFELKASDDASHRLFQRSDVRIRVRIDLSMRRELIAVSPGDPQSFDWVSVSVAPGVLKDRSADFLAARLRDLISKQNVLQRARNA